MISNCVRSAALTLTYVLAACAANPNPLRVASGEALVRVRNASAVPLRIRLCGDPCTAYVAAGPGEAVDLHFDPSRQSRFVVSAMEGDRLVAQEPFTANAGAVVVLSVRPPDIERLR
ncbi:MAG TPA: hypothetical protein VHG91_21655 [Longimicrobium sp.]|nr:hypothetical protein [Longimicrobium sp.]